MKANLKASASSNRELDASPVYVISNKVIDSNQDEKVTQKGQKDVLNLTENENAIDDEIIEVSLPGQ